MTVAEFVETIFVPEHVANKRTSGRQHYQSMLKHILTPEEVDRIFEERAEHSATKLKVVEEWPYLSSRLLRDVSSEDVERLVQAALSRGYSTQTVEHIRSVVRAVFSYAAQKGLMSSKNPASSVKMPAVVHKEIHVLTAEQIRNILRLMRYPEKELTIVALFTDLNMVEICGLQWKHVNVEDRPVLLSDEVLPPRTIAVRTQSCESGLDTLTRNSRSRNVVIRDQLIRLLTKMRERESFTGPEDLVFPSSTGQPLNAKGLASRRLKTIGKRAGVPWLSWHVFQRTHIA
jgi:site-specific recombinase XerD